MRAVSQKYDMKAEPPNDDPQLHGQLVTVNDTRDQGPGNTAGTRTSGTADPVDITLGLMG